MELEPGLRERKKRATRRALADAALDLALREGLDEVSLERIAGNVGVSARTFHNYFSTKEEAVVARLQDFAVGVADRVRRRPPTEPVWDSLRVVLHDLMREVQQGRDLQRLMALAYKHRALFAQHLAAYEEMSQQLARVIAERTGTDAEADIYPRLLADAAGVAVTTCLRLWTRNPDRDVYRILSDSLDLLRAGLPAPSVAQSSNGSDASGF